MKYMKPSRDNLRHSCMHLTNYSLNKFSPNFEYSDTEMDKGSKWSLSGLYRALASRGHDTKKLKRQIKKLVVMTLIAIAPYLAHNYKNCVNEDDNGRSCFEVLGLDILIDEKCKPWLLEVNHSPSFSIDTPLDLKVKEALLSDTLALIHIDPASLSKNSMTEKKNSKMRLMGGRDKRDVVEEQREARSLVTKEMEQYEAEHIGNFDLIYPCDDENLQNLYDICLAGAQESFKQSFDMKVKKAIEKVQEVRKQEAIERELEEKKKIKQRAQLKKRAQESARQVALSRQQSDAAESEDGQTKSVAEDDPLTDELRLLQKQLDWNPPPASLITSSSPRETPRKDIKLSPRFLPSLPSLPDKKVSWENSLRNDSPYGNSGFIRPQAGLLPPIRQVIDTYSQTSPRLKLFESGKQVARQEEYNEFSYWQGDASGSSSYNKVGEDSSESGSLSGKRTTTKLPDIKGRNSSMAPPPPLVNSLPLRTLPTAKLIFDEPSVSSSRTEPLKVSSEGGTKAKANELKSQKEVVKEASTLLHVCHICKPMKRIPRYECSKSRKSLRDYLSGSSTSEVASSKPVDPVWKFSDALLPPKERVINAFVTQTDPNRFLTLARSFHRS